VDADSKQFEQAWDSSYARRENYVFAPCDEMVRFVSRYLRCRIDLHEIVDLSPGAAGALVADIGCGIGRNLLFGTDMGLSMHGCDLSGSAVAVARKWLSTRLGANADDRVVVADVRNLPWNNAAFAHAVSDSVLDSMPFLHAQEGLREISRIVRPGGYFYCSLISGDESGRDPEFDGEEIVENAHERGTVQSYFNLAKIRLLLDKAFEIRVCELHQVVDPLRGRRSGRWHVTAIRRST
jgi:SAM-dependent methyltransferase